MKLYFGNETQKALRNFKLSGIKVDPDFIHCLALVKLAALNTNFKLKKISSKKYNAIKKAIMDIIDGKFDNQFNLDMIQGGAGTSINMNINEVIANIASETAGLEIDYLDDVNMSQSTNDVIPTALRVYILSQIAKTKANLEFLKKIVLRKAADNAGILKPGRTHLQDALPIPFKDVFLSYADLINRLEEYFEDLKKYLLKTNLGGTAIGTKTGTPGGYAELVIKNLEKITGYPFVAVGNLVDLTQNNDIFLHTVGIINTTAVSISKIANDIRLLASGPGCGLEEIILPDYQKGSTIMPGKNNPVTLEAFTQVANDIHGAYNSVYLDLSQGQLELNVMMPNIIKSISNCFKIFNNALIMIADTLERLKVNKSKCQGYIRNSIFIERSAIGKDKYINIEKKIRIKSKR